MLDFHRDEALRRLLLSSRLERFIGVIYRPDIERRSHYVAASLQQQFDAFVCFDETTAVLPLSAQLPKGGGGDTYPFALSHSRATARWRAGMLALMPWDASWVPAQVSITVRLAIGTQDVRVQGLDQVRIKASLS